MITFAQARTIAAEAGAREFAAAGYRGTYYADTVGYELADVYVVVDGAREDLLEGDPEFSILDKPITLVDKLTGEVRYVDHDAVREALRDAPEVDAAGDPTTGPGSPAQ